MKNRVCEILGIEKPVIQGPMVWLTDAKLASAVSKAGELGSLAIELVAMDKAGATNEELGKKMGGFANLTYMMSDVTE